MKDFTLQAYREYLGCLKSSFPNILRIDEYLLASPRPERFCLIRHDVDRNPRRALRMAEIENLLGLKTTYYFRTKRHTFKPGIMRSISDLGHEIGYHYESLSDARGDRDRAIEDFEENLSGLREAASIRTAAMHGRPFSQFNNLELWGDPATRSRLKERFGLVGEAYLDIDYSDIAYITDTGRSWGPDASNVRDKVRSDVQVGFKDGKQLLDYLRRGPHPKLVFSVHPERWTRNALAWVVQANLDLAVNIAKRLLA